LRGPSGGWVADFEDGAEDLGLGVGDGAFAGIDDGLEGAGAVEVEEGADAGFGVLGDVWAPVELFAVLDEPGEMLADGAFGESARPGDVADGHAGPEHGEGGLEGVGAGALDRAGRCGGHGAGVGVLLGEPADGGEERVAISRDLGLTEAGEGGEGGFGIGEAGGHGTEGAVAEDDVGRDLRVVGEILAEGAEDPEELVVAGFLVGAVGGAGGLDAEVFEEFDPGVAAGEAVSGGGDGGDRVGVVAEGEELLGDEGVGEAAPVCFRVRPAGAVAVQAIVFAFADAGGVGSGEDVTDVDGAEAFTGFAEGGEEEPGVVGGVGGLGRSGR